MSFSGPYFLICFSVKWDELCGTEQRAAFASRCFGIEQTWHSWAAHHQEVHVVLHGRSPCLLASGHCFRAGTGLPIGCLTDFSLSVDRKAAATYSLVLYNTAEVVCQWRHFAIARAHHADEWLPLQQFKRRLKPKPKRAYNGMGKITICPGGRLHWGGAYIRNYTVSPHSLSWSNFLYRVFTWMSAHPGASFAWLIRALRSTALCTCEEVRKVCIIRRVALCRRRRT